MDLKPTNVKAEYINGDEDFTVKKIWGSLTLVYGTPRKKNCKGIAFKDTDMVRRVANKLIAIADYQDTCDKVISDNDKGGDKHGKVRNKQ